MASQTAQKPKTGTKTTAGKSTRTKNAASSAARTAPARSTAKKSTRGKSAARKKNVGNQHREIWVVLTFFLSLVLLLAVFNVKGFLLEALSSFCKGLLGFGAYILPFALLIVCGTILFAHGKPIAGRIVLTLLIPVMVGVLSHLLFSDVRLDAHVIPQLYQTGKTLLTGGVIAGGIGAAMSAALSKVGALIIGFIIFTLMLLYFFHIRIRNILDFFIGVHDKVEVRREPLDFYDESYEEAEDDGREAVAPLPAARKEPVLADPVKSAAAQERRAAVARQAEQDRHDRLAALERRERQAAKTRQEKQENRRAAFDLPLDAEPPAMEKPEAGPVPASTIVMPPLHVGMEKAGSAYRKPDVHYEEPAYEPPRPLDDELEGEPPFAEEPGTEAAAPDPVEQEGPETFPEAPHVEEVKTERIPVGPASAAPDPVVVDTHQLTEEAPADDEALKRAQATARREYEFPPISILHEDDFVPEDDVTEELRVRSHKLADTLSSFGVEAQIINVIRGPSVTRYEILLDRGVKFSRLTSLQDDIALALGASGVRIAAIPDKSAVGIEVPNKVVQTVYLRDVLTSRPMAESKSKLAFALGKDITGTSIIADIGKMPHMLIAGTTGSGKSVCINSIIISLLYRASPKEVKLIMIDPKMVELGNYNGIPHLLVPVVTDYKKAAGALNWAVVEMERRYKLMFEYGARDLDSFNKVAEGRGEEPLPRIVIIIDELADLMMMAAKEIEESICRIAQKARAAGMHLIIATQRPSADVLTGLMKSNIPSRIAFAVASQIESRIILDTGGAEKLIGKGDMLFNPLGTPKPVRVQGCYLSSSEVEAVTEFVKQSGTAEYSSEILEHMERSAASDHEGGGYADDEEADDMLDDAIDVVMQTGQASASMLQRKLKLGYARAARIIDQMEDRGIIGPFDGAKPRQLLISKTDWQEIKARRAY